jgi:ParB family chromosome partitioning protein
VGLLQPVVVRKVGDGSYELVMGERRWRASQRAGLDVIPAIVRDTNDDDMLRDALMENLHRQQLDPLEEAAAYQQLLDDFGATHEQLAQKIGRSRPHISNTLRLLNLPPAVQKRVAAGVISAGHARALLSIEDPAAQERLAQKIVAEGLSVRAVEEIVALGEEGPVKSPRKAPLNKPVAPALRVLADRLSDRFETRVKVELGRSKGKITVEFATIDDLERIVKAMAPEDTGHEAAQD